MKTGIKFLGAFILFLHCLMLPAQSGPFVLNIKVKEFSKPEKAFLTYHAKGQQITDSALFKNGCFRFIGNIDEPGEAFLIISHNDIYKVDQLYFYLEPLTISIVTPDILSNSAITGGTLNNDNARLKKSFAPILAKNELINKEWSKASPKEKESKEFKDYMDRRIDSIMNDLSAANLVFIKTNPNSLLSLLLLKEQAYTISKAEDVDLLFNSLSQTVRATQLGIDYATALEKERKTSVGNIAPDFTQPDTSGNLVSLHDFKSKYVLIDFGQAGAARAEGKTLTWLKHSILIKTKILLY